MLHARSDAPTTILRWAGVERASEWKLGGCISVDDGEAKAVDCTLAHDGHVREILTKSDDCPVGTDPDKAVLHDGHYYCIDANGSS